MQDCSEILRQEQELKDLVHWRHPTVEYRSTRCPTYISANSSSMSLPTLLLYFRRSSVGLQVYLCVDRVSTDMSTNRVGRYDNSSTYRSTGQRHAWWTLLLGLSFLYFFRVFRVWLVSVWPCLAIRNELARKRLLYRIVTVSARVFC